MLKIYKTEEQIIEEREQLEEGVWVQMTSPSMEESQKIADYFDIDITDIRAALDDVETYITVPLGILLTQGAIITVCTEETPVLQHFVKRRVRDFSTKKKMRFVYQILFQTAALYQSDLRIIDKKRTAIEERVGENTEDEDLIDLHSLESTLVYFATSLRSNATVLDRLTRYKRLEQYPDDRELLDDVIVEIRQARCWSGISSHCSGGCPKSN